MQQLPLDLHRPAPASLSNFELGDNAEAVSLLAGIAGGDRGQRFVYLWGPDGAGKTHLLQALAGATGVPVGDGTPAAPMPAYRPECHLYLVDDCHRLGPEAQQALFTLINHVQAASGATVVITGESAPAAMPLREDLRTRLGWGLVFGLIPLSDEQKLAALQRMADERGVACSADLLPYLLRHYRRDMRSLAALLEALDRFAYERRRPLTLPLLREYESLRR
ncbi:MAG: DnaA regulatory inactivator Hda [Burkholderiaceae bacterium]